MWYKSPKIQKYALNSQLQALQILTNNDEVENRRLSSFLLGVIMRNLNGIYNEFDMKIYLRKIIHIS